jgi:hypothetical protein
VDRHGRALEAKAQFVEPVFEGNAPARGLSSGRPAGLSMTSASPSSKRMGISIMSLPARVSARRQAPSVRPAACIAWGGTIGLPLAGRWRRRADGGQRSERRRDPPSASSSTSIIGRKGDAEALRAAKGRSGHHRHAMLQQMQASASSSPKRAISGAASTMQ